MNSDIELLRALPSAVYASPATDDAWDACVLAQAPDARLINAVAATVTPLKATASSSFISHAPLELLARAALLPYVVIASRPAARRRIAEIGVRYAHAGEEVAAPTSRYGNTTMAITALKDALASGDVETTDAALTFLSSRLPISTLRATLVDDLVPMLGAAAHAPILLAALPHFTGRIEGLAGLLRAPLRKIAAAHNLRVTWHQDLAAGSAMADAAHELFLRLAAPPRVASPSDSIAPTILAVQASGDAKRLLADPLRQLAFEDVERVLLEVAAWSMLQDDAKVAPYTWTHCLTLPQALMKNADVAQNRFALIAVAATEVLAFRATEGKVALDATRAPPRSMGATPLDEMVSSPPEVAASIAFHAGPHLHQACVNTLATNAACHRDAHLVKYTLACFDAALRHQASSPLFLAAAAYLAAWWHQHDSTGDAAS